MEKLLWEMKQNEKPNLPKKNNIPTSEGNQQL